MMLAIRGNISLRSDIAGDFHGVFRLRSVRLATFTPLKMTRIGVSTSR
jgi:hypothetical protein